VETVNQYVALHTYDGKGVDKSKCVIISLYMDNINPKTVEAHRSVMATYNAGFKNFYIKTPYDHGTTMDAVWQDSQLKDYEYILFLDIDAIPLNLMALEWVFDQAYRGRVAGNVQRSNHLNNGQHMFVAPSVVCMSRETYAKLGSPSARPTNRGDVGEEYTFAARAKGVDVELLWPIKYDRPVVRMAWEQDRSPTWKLADSYPEYGVGTTFGIVNDPKDIISSISMFWHSFQSFHSNHQELFWKKCEEVLNPS
jgi:hypothetical protein